MTEKNTTKEQTKPNFKIPKPTSTSIQTRTKNTKAHIRKRVHSVAPVQHNS